MRRHISRSESVVLSFYLDTDGVCMTKRNLKTLENRGQSRQQNVGLVLSIAAGSLLLGLIGCSGGGSSDPTAQYKDLKANMAPHSNVTRTQKVVPTTHVITIEKTPTFIEGKPGSFTIGVSLLQPGVTSFDLNILRTTPVTPGLVMAKSATDANTFVVSWTPPKGTVPTALPLAVSFELEISNVKATDPEVETLYKSSVMQEQGTFNVQRTGNQPEIVDAGSLPAQVAQGSVTPFNVAVTDAASTPTNPPRVDIYFSGTNKTEKGYKANGATYVRTVSTPKYDASTGQWKFAFAFDAQNNDVGAQLDVNGNRVDGATELQTRLFMKVYGVTGVASSERMVNTSITYKTPQVANPKPLVCPAPQVETKATSKASPKAASKASAKNDTQVVSKTEVKK